MDHGKNDEVFTVQGRDTPVPVRGSSGRAGSPGPSACDRSAPPVGNQAGGGYIATGGGGASSGGLEGFVRGGIRRTPPPQRSNTKQAQERVTDLVPRGCKTGDEVSTEDQGQSDPEVFFADSEGSGTLDNTKKRKERLSSSPPRRGQGVLPYKRIRSSKEEEDDEERLCSDLGKIIAKLRNSAVEMGELVKKNPNTKVELKKLINEFEGTSDLLCKKSQKLLGAGRLLTAGRLHRGAKHSLQEGRGGDTSEDSESPTIEELSARLARITEDNRKLRRDNALLTKEIRKLGTHGEQVTDQMLRNKETFEEYVELERLEWPNTVFKAAFLESGSPLVLKPNTDHLVIYEEGKYRKETEGLRKAFEERFPELREAEEGGGAIKISTRVLTRDGKENVRERWLVRMEAGESAEIWFKSLSRAKVILHDGNRKEVVVYPPGFDSKGEGTRKMLEFIFRNSGIKCYLHVRGAHEQGGVRGEERRPRGKRPEALVISQEGKTYADLLKVVKEKILPDSEAAKAVRTIREARDGRKMVIILDKAGGAAADQLKGELGRLEEVHIKNSTSREEETIYIQDIDGLTSKDDVAREICQETGLLQEQVTVSDLRRGFGGNSAVTVRLPRDKASEICGKERIRIGLNLCPVKERVEVTRCFRCWKYGHIGRECREERDDSKLCRKCGGAGHIAADCARLEWCLTCKTEGHTAGSGACPEFRRALERARKARKRRRGY